MKLTAAHRAYWRRNLMLTLSLLALWFGITFGGAYHAVALNRLYLFDFPLAYYLFAQGSLILYLVIVGIYVVVMNRLDRRYGFDERRSPPRR